MTRFRNYWKIDKDESLNDKVNRVAKKALFDDHFMDEDDSDMRFEEMSHHELIDLIKDQREVNWRLNQVVKKLFDSGIKDEIIVSNLLKQAIDIAYWNLEDEEECGDFIRDLFEFHMDRTLLAE